MQKVKLVRAAKKSVVCPKFCLHICRCNIISWAIIYRRNINYSNLTHIYFIMDSGKPECAAFSVVWFSVRAQTTNGGKDQMTRNKSIRYLWQILLKKLYYVIGLLVHVLTERPHCVRNSAAFLQSNHLRIYVCDEHEQWARGWHASRWIV